MDPYEGSICLWHMDSEPNAAFAEQTKYHMMDVGVKMPLSAPEMPCWMENEHGAEVREGIFISPTRQNVVDSS